MPSSPVSTPRPRRRGVRAKRKRRQPQIHANSQGAPRAKILQAEPKPDQGAWILLDSLCARRLARSGRWKTGSGKPERAPGSECRVVVGDGGCEAYTAIVWGVLLSRESQIDAETETVRKISCLTTGLAPSWSASGRRGAEADDARA